MIVIFLDVDGVLNSSAYMIANPGSFDRASWITMLDPIACGRLERVLVATGAQIVLSSTWRKRFNARQMQGMLRRRGAPSAEVIDVTPNGVLVNNCQRAPNKCVEPGVFSDRYGVRGHEIQRWLTLHPEVMNFAIIDDDSDMVHLMQRLVHTSWLTGMLDEHVDGLIEMLRTDG